MFGVNPCCPQGGTGAKSLGIDGELFHRSLRPARRQLAQAATLQLSRFQTGNSPFADWTKAFAQDAATSATAGMVRANLPLARVRSGRVLRSRDAACEKLKATTADLQRETGIDPAALTAQGASFTIASQ